MAVKSAVCIPREPSIDLVQVISEGTYTSFPQALKEFVSNAYDADATRVDLLVDEECNSIIVRDNGVGMTVKEFGDFFASIARTGKAGARSARGRTSLGRRKIGRFGIGSLAVVGAADNLVIRSVRRYTGRGFEASIDLRELRKHFGRGEDLSAHWRFGVREWSGERRSESFTEVVLEGLDPDIRSFLQRPGERTREEFFESTRQLSGVEELAWRLGVICPVAYEFSYPLRKEHLDRRRDAEMVRNARELLSANFSVFLNAMPVRRPIVLPQYHARKLEKASEGKLLQKRGTGFDVTCFHAPRGAPVHYEGYVLVQAAQLLPVESRGLVVRVRGVAIGWHGTVDLSASVMATMAPSFSGEVWVEGLDDALQFDRESFREDHPKFRWVREQLEGILAKEVEPFRRRSAKRREALKSLTAGEEPTQEGEAAQTSGKRGRAARTERASGEEFISSEILEGQRPYIKHLVPQINGCWERGYYEACAMTIRRLMQTLIMELYDRRGWIKELMDARTKEFVGLKKMVSKVCDDGRFRLDKSCADGLRQLKELGDIAAHDFRVKVRKSDLEAARSRLRYACERLLFYLEKQGD